MAPKAKKKKKPSPRLKRPEDRAQIVSTSVRPVVKAWLTQVGGGTLTAGMRKVLDDEYEKQAGKNSENLS